MQKAKMRIGSVKLWGGMVKNKNIFKKTILYIFLSCVFGDVVFAAAEVSYYGVYKRPENITKPEELEVLTLPIAKKNILYDDTSYFISGWGLDTIRGNLTDLIDVLLAKGLITQETADTLHTRTNLKENILGNLNQLFDAYGNFMNGLQTYLAFFGEPPIFPEVPTGVDRSATTYEKLKSQLREKQDDNWIHMEKIKTFNNYYNRTTITKCNHINFTRNIRLVSTLNMCHHYEQFYGKLLYRKTGTINFIGFDLKSTKTGDVGNLLKITGKESEE